jgi:hypothetical protein
MADNNQLTDILIVIDAESIMENFKAQLPGSADRPIFIGTDTNLIYMFVRKDEVVSGEGTSDLNVHIEPDSIVRWRATSLTGNTRYNVALNACGITQGQSFISAPTPIVTTVYAAIPQVNNGLVTGTSKQSINDFFFQAIGNGSGQVTYTFTFAITDNDGHVRGYFKWDPHLSIS